jgi:MraZ protein
LNFFKKWCKIKEKWGIVDNYGDNYPFLWITKNMFFGEFHHNLDEKGRLAIPVKFRKELKDGAVVAKSLEGCLALYSKNDWKEFANKLNQLPISQKDARSFARFFLTSAMEVNLDSQGRILIPDYLRDYCSLKKKSVITGMGNKIEIWNENTWEEYKDKAEKNSVETAEKLGNLGI